MSFRVFALDVEREVALDATGGEEGADPEAEIVEFHSLPGASPRRPPYTLARAAAANE